MSEFLKNNPTALRTCIFYESRRTKNVEEAFKNFCEAIGVDVIEYVDFEYWFYRFYHGNLDFDHDRSADPKALILTDLPMEMLNEIVGNLDIWNRFNVRKVSKKLENIVDSFKSKYDNITIEFERQNVFLYIKNSNVYYEKEKTGFMRSANKNQKLNSQLSDVSTVLTNSKSPINYFFISTLCSEIIDTEQKLIDAFSKEISPVFYAKHIRLELQHNEYVIQLVSLFKPGVLEHLNLNVCKCDDDTFARLVEMDQFKQLKSIKWYRCKPLSLSQFKQLSHLTTFEVRIGDVSAEEIIIIRDILSQFANLRRANISLCSFMKLSEIGTSLGIDYDTSGLITYRHPISNSDKSLILYIDRCSIEVTIENN